MRKPLGTVVLAISVWAAALALPMTAYAKDDAVNATAAAASSPAAAAQAELATPKVKRVRKASPRRVAATSASYHSQCFLFWCGGGGRSFHWLVLGVAY